MTARLLAALTASAVGAAPALFILHHLHTFAATLERITP